MTHQATGDWRYRGQRGLRLGLSLTAAVCWLVGAACAPETEVVPAPPAPVAAEQPAPGETTPPPAPGKTVELNLPITADDDICCASKETTFNQGGKNTLKLKGIENLMLLNFEADKLKGLLVTKATLHIKGTDARMMVRHVGFSTVASPWKEGTQKDNAALNGELCLQTPQFGSGEMWAGPESTFTDCYGGRGGTLWAQTYVTHDAEMWYTMDVDPRMVEACAAGLSYGLCMTDDNGQTGRGSKEVVKDGNQSNNWFYAREQHNAAPYLTVTAAAYTTATASPTPPPRVDLVVKPWPHGADTASGGLEITWPGPKTAEAAAAVLGYTISLAVDGGPLVPLPHWHSPTPVLAGEPVRALLRGMKPSAAVTARIEVITRAGLATAYGQADGTVSPAFLVPTALVLPALPLPASAAGALPTVEGSTIWAIPDCAKANPLTGNLQEEPGVDYEGEPAGKSREGNAIWSGATSTVHLHALRGEWVAFQIVCQNKDATAVSYQLQPGDLTGPADATIPAAAFELSTAWYLHATKADRGWYVDPLVPLKAGQEFAVPNVDNAVPGQLNQTVYVELFVPKTAAAGSYKGALTVAVGKTALPLHVELDVATAAIPNETHFTLSMNAYSSPGAGFGPAMSDAYVAADLAFYKLCHLHRTDLMVVHYSQSSVSDAGSAPPIEGTGAEAHVKDWSEFDKRFGPLLDGSLFNGTPREGTTVSHFMLNLNEAYPTPMTAYKWNDVKWEEHWKVCGPVKDGFPQAYQDAFVAIARDYVRHAREKHYLAPYEVMLNNKYFYKQYVDRKKAWGRGTSFWLCDEPQEIDDFELLAFFGGLVRQAQDGDRQRLQYRVDVSRPQWGRTYVDRVSDLNVSGGFGAYRHLLEDWRERYGVQVWTYAGTPEPGQSAVGIEAQSVDLYSRGVEGYVPAESTGDADAWTKASWASVIYSGKPRGIAGPCASLRLKAYRRGEQDVEYVYLLAQQRGLLQDDPNHRQIAKLLDGAIAGTKKLGTLDAEGAVTESITGLTPETFERLRQAIASELK